MRARIHYAQVGRAYRIDRRSRPAKGAALFPQEMHTFRPLFSVVHYRTGRKGKRARRRIYRIAISHVNEGQKG